MSSFLCQWHHRLILKSSIKGDDGDNGDDDDDDHYDDDEDDNDDDDGKVSVAVASVILFEEWHQRGRSDATGRNLYTCHHPPDLDDDDDDNGDNYDGEDDNYDDE